MNLYQTIHTSWVVECVRNFGTTLPMNAISVGYVEFMLSDKEQPILHNTGVPARGFRLWYDVASVREDNIVN